MYKLICKAHGMSKEALHGYAIMQSDGVTPRHYMIAYVEINYEKQRLERHYAERFERTEEELFRKRFSERACSAAPWELPPGHMPSAYFEIPYAGGSGAISVRRVNADSWMVYTRQGATTQIQGHYDTLEKAIRATKMIADNIRECV